MTATCATLKPDPLISVVIPAYNVAPFVEECLRSLMAQTLRDFEVILIDDASTDDTWAKVTAFDFGDIPAILRQQKDNKGQGAARNVGISLARGRYLCFVDSDDCLYPQALEMLADACRRERLDVCRCGWREGTEYHPVRYDGIGKVKVYDYRSAVRKGLYQKLQINSPWGMLIEKRLVVEAGGFREGIIYEDLDAFYRFYEHAERIGYLKRELYFYRTNLRSTINTWGPRRFDVLNVTDRMVEFFAEKYPELLKAAEDRRFSAHYNMVLLMRKHRVQDIVMKSRCRDVVLGGRLRALLDPRVRLKNKIGALLAPLLV